MAATSMPVGQAATVAELLTRSRYEVIPLARRRGAGAQHVPRDVTLTVTASPVKGLDHMLDLVARLAGQGIRRAASLGAPGRRPHAPDRADLPVTELGMCDDVSVVAGDADRPAGAFEGASALLDAMTRWIVRPDRDHGVSGEPSADRRRDDDRVHFGRPSCDLHRGARSVRLAGHGRLDRQRLGSRDGLPDPRGHPGHRAPGRACASRPGSESANRSLRAQARRLRGAVPAARRVQPRPPDRGPRASAAWTRKAEDRQAPTSSLSTTWPTPRRGRQCRLAG